MFLKRVHNNLSWFAAVGRSYDTSRFELVHDSASHGVAHLELPLQRRGRPNAILDDDSCRLVY